MNLTKYRNEIKDRIKIGAGIIVLVVILFVVIKNIQGNLTNIESFSRGYIDGVLAAIGFIGLGIMIMNYRMLRDEEKLKKSYVKENDEREIFVNSKAYAISYRVMLVVLLIASVVASFISIEVLFLLLWLIVISCSMLIASLFYYDKKY